MKRVTFLCLPLFLNQTYSPLYMIILLTSQTWRHALELEILSHYKMQNKKNVNVTIIDDIKLCGCIQTTLDCQKELSQWSLLYMPTLFMLDCWTCHDRMILNRWGGILAPYRAPPLFAFFIWYGNKSMLVQHVDQRSSGKKASTLKICIYSSLLLSDFGMNSLSRVLFKPWVFSNFKRVLQTCRDLTHHGIKVHSSNDIVLLKAIFTKLNLILGLEEVTQ